MFADFYCDRSWPDNLLYSFGELRTIPVIYLLNYHDMDKISCQSFSPVKIQEKT